MNRLTLAVTAALLCSVSLSAQAASDDVEWSWSGDTGPDQWGDLHPDFAECRDGRQQSPIDLNSPSVVADVPVFADYREGPLNLANLGKTVQANFESGSYLSSSGHVYGLIQVHFHTPSEHTIDGEAFPLVAHFVHANGDGQLAVLGVLFEEGDAHDELQKIVESADDVGAEAETVRGVSLDPAAFLPDELEVWRYNGSLTTPPCSEGVQWHVLEDTVEASGEQIEALAALMGDNARPVLPRHGRLLIAPE